MSFGIARNSFTLDVAPFADGILAPASGITVWALDFAEAIPLGLNGLLSIGIRFHLGRLDGTSHASVVQTGMCLLRSVVCDLAWTAWHVWDELRINIIEERRVRDVRITRIRITTRIHGSSNDVSR